VAISTAQGIHFGDEAQQDFYSFFAVFRFCHLSRWAFEILAQPAGKRENARGIPELRRQGIARVSCLLVSGRHYIRLRNGQVTRREVE
jgi:hypothetical protein